MAKVQFVIPTKMKKGTNLLKFAKKAGVEINAPCKKGKCEKCLVKVEGKVNAPTTQELKALTAAELEQGYRLACQVEVLGKCKVVLPKVE